MGRGAIHESGHRGGRSFWLANEGARPRPAERPPSPQGGLAGPSSHAAGYDAEIVQQQLLGPLGRLGWQLLETKLSTEATQLLGDRPAPRFHPRPSFSPSAASLNRIGLL